MKRSNRMEVDEEGSTSNNDNDAMDVDAATRVKAKTVGGARPAR